MILDTCVAFDLETTSVDVETARILTASVVTMRDGVAEDARLLWANPGIPIPPAATEINGITDADLVGRPPSEDVVVQIEGLLAVAAIDGIPLVAMNAAYDFTVLDREVARLYDGRALAFEPRPTLDPYVLDKAVDPYRRGSRRLADMAAHYGIPNDNAHDAVADAIMAARIAREILRDKKFPDDATAEDVHRWSIAWRARQMESLADYFRSQGKDEAAATCRTEWPIYPRNEQ